MNEMRKDEKNSTKNTVVLLCLSSSPSSRRVIQAAAEFLRIEGSEGIAIYITPHDHSPDDNPRLQENIALAKESGFEFHSLQSDDILVSITEYAKRISASHLFLGYTAPPVLLQTKRPVSEQLTQALPNVIIHVIPDPLSSPVPLMQKKSGKTPWNIHDFVLVLAIMAAATFMCFWVDQSRYSNANIITIYILAVLIASLWTSHQIYGIMASVLYILLFNFLFIEPRFTLLVYDPEYLMTYFVTMAAALITGTLAVRVKNIARRSAENAYQAKILLDTSNQLEQAQSADEIISISCRQLATLLSRTVLFYGKDEISGEPQIYPLSAKAISLAELQKDHETIVWVKEHRHYAGAYTSRWPDCPRQYLSIHTDEYGYGIIGIDMSGGPFSEFENMILHSILNEFAMALENERIEQERQHAEIKAENERMRASFLRSISHDLRTPLTSIYGNATNLSANEKYMSEDDRRKVYTDIRDDAVWLVDEMENILSVTRLESDPKINLSAENVEDVIEESLRRVSSHSSHQIIVRLPDYPLFALMDAKLISQVLVNLLSNAVKYTPEDTEIIIAAEKKDDIVEISVADQGEGIDDEEKEQVFELFHTGKSAHADSSRSMGVGLNVCRMIMQAHGSTISVHDNVPHGSVFVFTLKAEDIKYE